jgi:hypothetical protein
VPATWTASNWKDSIPASRRCDQMESRAWQTVPNETAPARQIDEGTGRREVTMLYTAAVVLLVLWLLGLVSGYTIGSFIHVLLVVAIVLFLVGVINGRRLA